MGFASALRCAAPLLASSLYPSLPPCPCPRCCHRCFCTAAHHTRVHTHTLAAAAPTACLPACPAAEERFFQKLEGEVEKCNAFTARVVAQLREGLKQLQARARSTRDDSQRDAMLEVWVGGRWVGGGGVGGGRWGGVGGF